MKRWMIIALVAAIFCMVRGAFDIGDGRYVWGALGIVVGLLLALMPIPIRARKFDLVDG